MCVCVERGAYTIVIVPACLPACLCYVLLGARGSPHTNHPRCPPPTHSTRHAHTTNTPPPTPRGEAACDSPSQDVPCMFTETIVAPAGSYNSLTHQVAFCKMQVRSQQHVMHPCPRPVPTNQPTSSPTPTHPHHPIAPKRTGVRHSVPGDLRGPLRLHLGPRQDRRRPRAPPVRLAHGGRHVEGPGRLASRRTADGGPTHV